MSDFRNRRNGGGGSQKGRDQRRCPDAFKVAIDIWATHTIAHGDDRIFHTSIGEVPRRWSKFYWCDLPALLERFFPEEYERQMGGNSQHPDRRARAANILMNRHHKQFYDYDGVSSWRDGYGGEHFGKWTLERQAQAMADVAAAGWRETVLTLPTYPFHFKGRKP